MNQHKTYQLERDTFGVWYNLDMVIVNYVIDSHNVYNFLYSSMRKEFQ